MPLRLSNAPATFQRLINNIMRVYLDNFVIAYLDNILVFSQNLKEHIQHVRKVLKKLNEWNLTISLEKSEFHKSRVEFLGYIITSEGLEMSKEKVKAVLEWPKPRTLKELQSFLGFAGYYRKFIKGYGEITTPLTELTKKGKPFEWTPECQQWFESLKQRFCEELILKNHDAEKEIIFKTNASDHSVGACMSHQR